MSADTGADRAEHQFVGKLVEGGVKPGSLHLAVADLAQQSGEPGQIVLQRKGIGVNTGAKTLRVLRRRRRATRVS